MGIKTTGFAAGVLIALSWCVATEANAQTASAAPAQGDASPAPSNAQTTASGDTTGTTAAGANNGGTTDASPNVATPAQPAANPVVVRQAPGRFMVHMNVAFNAFTWIAPSGTANEYWAYPGHRSMLLQQIGAGYWIHPNLRVQLTFQFAEFLDNIPVVAGQQRSALSLMGVIPWLVYTRGIFFAGAGPLLAWWAYGRPGFGAGIFTAVGISVPVGHGWALGAAVQAPFLWGERFSAGVSPSVFVARRF